MKRNVNSLRWLTLFLILALTLVACERPAPGSEAGNQDTTAPLENPVLIIPTTPPEIDPFQPGGYPAPGETAPGEAGQPTEGAPEGEAAQPAPGEGEPAAPADTSPPAPDSSTGTTDSSSATGERIHVVQSGENLYRIGLLYGFTYQDLAAYNGLANPNVLDVGQEIRIPPSN